MLTGIEKHLHKVAGGMDLVDGIKETVEKKEPFSIIEDDDEGCKKDCPFCKKSKCRIEFLRSVLICTECYVGLDIKEKDRINKIEEDFECRKKTYCMLVAETLSSCDDQS